MAVIDDKENSKKGKKHYFSHKQVVATATTVVSAKEPKTYNTMAHFRKKWVALKDEFHSDKPTVASSRTTTSVVAKASPNKTSWKIWKKRKDAIKGPEPSIPPQQQQQQYQAFFNFNVPIVISSTHNYYKQDYSEKEEEHQHHLHSKEPTHSIIRQLTIIPSFNVNLLLTVILVALLVIAFGILQIHRTISILNTGIDFVKYTLMTSLSVSKSLTFTVLSLFR